LSFEKIYPRLFLIFITAKELIVKHENIKKLN